MCKPCLNPGPSNRTEGLTECNERTYNVGVRQGRQLAWWAGSSGQQSRAVNATNDAPSRDKGMGKTSLAERGDLAPGNDNPGEIRCVSPFGLVARRRRPPQQAEIFNNGHRTTSVVIRHVLEKSPLRTKTPDRDGTRVALHRYGVCCAYCARYIMCW